MTNIKGLRVQEFFLLISDSGNAFASKFITFFGVAVGIGGGAVQVAIANSQNELIQKCSEATPSWLAYISAAAAISLVVKNLTDAYYMRVKHKEDK